MGVGTLARGTTFMVNFANVPGQVCYAKDNGVYVVERAPVFRSGTFRDMMGTQATYDPLHIKQLVTNFQHLRSTGVFADVPVRDGHPSFLMSGMPGNGQVIGWNDQVWDEELPSPVDGQKYQYVLANLRITDPAAAAKVANGTFKHRSAEIGTYTTNNESEFWPAYMGVAYVDIPAVEGLQFSSSNSSASSSRRRRSASESGSRQTIILLYSQNKETGVTRNSPGTPAPAAAAAPVFGAPAQTVSFSIGGQTVTDVAAVQAHITALEMFQAQTTEANRAAFVNGLATSGKILATQVDSLIAFAKTLSAEQFATWSKTYDQAPAQSLTANHSAQTANGAPVTDATAQTQAAAVAGELTGDDRDLAVVQMMAKAGMPKAQIEGTPSFARLKAANKAPTL